MRRNTKPLFTGAGFNVKVHSVAGVERAALDGDFPRESALFHRVKGQSRKPAGRSASAESAAALTAREALAHSETWVFIPTSRTSVRNDPPAMPAANDIRKGQVIKFNGEPHLVMETQHRTPGNLRAFVQIKMRNLRYGKALDQRFASTDTIEVLPTDRRTLEFSYADRDTYSFIDPDTFDQTFELSADDRRGEALPDAGGKVEVLFVDEKFHSPSTALHSCPEDH
jgi:translation elongation factor P/translation initiation factor 5A